VHDVVQAIILGVLIGGVYALMASGLTLVFGIMKVINVAQGALVILAAYLSYALFAHLPVDPFLSILIVTPAMFVLGVAVQLVFVRSLRGPDASELSLLVTWALALGIEGVLSVVFQTTYRSTLPSYAYRSWDIFGYHVGLVRVLGFGASALLLGLLSLLLTRTLFGRAVRATVQNPVSARLLGVDAERGRKTASARREYKPISPASNVHARAHSSNGWSRVDHDAWGARLEPGVRWVGGNCLKASIANLLGATDISAIPDNDDLASRDDWLTEYNTRLSRIGCRLSEISADRGFVTRGSWIAVIDDEGTDHAVVARRNLVFFDPADHFQGWLPAGQVKYGLALVPTRRTAPPVFSPARRPPASPYAIGRSTSPA